MDGRNEPEPTTSIGALASAMIRHLAGPKPDEATIELFRTDFKFVGCQEALVVNARETRFDRAEGVPQRAQSGVAVWLLKSFPAKPFGLADVDLFVDWRRLSGRSA